MSVSAGPTPTVGVPSGAAEGDLLVLALSVNSSTLTASGPTGVTGWTQLDRVMAKTMGTTVWTKVAQAGDAGRAVSVPLSGVRESRP